jgi:hypothetical protein
VSAHVLTTEYVMHWLTFSQRRSLSRRTESLILRDCIPSWAPKSYGSILCSLAMLSMKDRVSMV